MQLQREEYAGAVDSFELCLRARPDWLEALLNLGLACWKFEDLDTAAQTFERVLAIDRNNGDAMRALVAIAIERKDHQHAWDLLERLTAAGEGAMELSYNLGLLLQAANEPERAAECYRQTLERRPDFAPALLNLGHAFQSLGREQEARQLWSRAVDTDPSLAAAYFH
jgi:tetratricopeptide (TPR) repeat protein